MNLAVRSELQNKGLVSRDSHSLPILVPLNDLTGADRQWAARYAPGEIVHYTKGSRELGIDRGSSVQVVAVDRNANRLTVSKKDG